MSKSLPALEKKVLSSNLECPYTIEAPETIASIRTGWYDKFAQMTGFDYYSHAPHWIRLQIAYEVTNAPLERLRQRIVKHGTSGMPKTRSLDFKDITKNMRRVEKEIYLMNNPVSDLNPWQPMRNKRDKKTIGKLGEECGELVAAIFRCEIQGIDGKEPVTGKPNREWLEEEIADVRASLELVEEHFKLHMAFIEARKRRKKKHLLTWHAML